MNNPEFVTLLSLAFERELRAVLTVGEFDDVVQANRTIPDGCCASGDYCDSNEQMYDAWVSVAGSAPDLDNPDHCETWGKAWDEFIRRTSGGAR
jgi:hypothetical protein